MKLGFSLIEISIVLLIASSMSLALYQVLDITKKGAISISEVINYSSPVINLYTQLEKDVNCIYIPKDTEEFYIEEFKKSVSAKATPDKQVETNKPEDKKEETKKNPVKDLFVVKQSENNLILSFVTTNGISSITIDKNKKPVVAPKAYAYRVAYVLEKKQDSTSTLYYRYSTNLEFANIEKSGQSYEIVDKVKNFKVKTVIKVQKKEENKEATSNLSTLEESWNEKAIFDKYKALIPAFVLFELTVVDNLGQEHDLNFEFPVFSYHNIKVPEPKKQAAPKEAEEKEHEKSNTKNSEKPDKRSALISDVQKLFKS